MLLLVAALVPALEVASPDLEPPLLLEVVDARGKRDVLPVFAPPRQRYLVLSSPAPSSRVATVNEPRLKGIAVRTFRDDATVAVELLLVLRGTPDQETTIATYRLAPDESAITTALEDYGLAPLTLRARRVEAVTTTAPTVENTGTSLVASASVVAGAMPLYRVRLHNASDTRGVVGVLLTLDFADGTVITRMPRGQRGKALVAPGGTAIEGLHSRGELVDGEFRPQAARRLRVVAVAYDDGSVEGRAGAADELAAGRFVEAWQIGRVLAAIAPADRPDGPPAIDTLQGLHRDLATLSWGVEQVTTLGRQCAPCSRLRPSTLRVIANLAVDQALQDLERLMETGDDNERRAQWSAYLAEYRAWASSRPN